MFQTKEQDKTPEEHLGNLPKKEFRVMSIKMIQELGKRMDAQSKKLQEVFNKDLEELILLGVCSLKKKQTEVNNIITEVKNTLEGISSRITVAEERISDLEDRKVEITAMEQNKEKE